jgi:hypothetical protein
VKLTESIDLEVRYIPLDNQHTLPSLRSALTLTGSIQHLQQTRLAIHHPLFPIAVFDSRIVMLSVSVSVK